jgi:hypothetical protein
VDQNNRRENIPTSAYSDDLTIYTFYGDHAVAAGLSFRIEAALQVTEYRAKSAHSSGVVFTACKHPEIKAARTSVERMKTKSFGARAVTVKSEWSQKQSYETR